MLNKFYYLLGKIKKSSLFKSAGVYTISSTLNKLIPFLLMPVLTRWLTPGDYGMVAMFTILVNLVTPITGLSIHGAIVRQYFDRKPPDMPVYVTNCLLILIVSTSLVALFFLFFGSYISELSSVPGNWLWAVIVVSFANFISTVVLVLWQVQIKPFKYSVYQNLKTVFNVGLSLFFVVLLGMNWQGRIQGIILSSVVFGIIGLIFLYRGRWYKPVFNKQYIQNALSFGIPLIPTNLKEVIMSITDKVFITNMVGLQATGLYTVGYQLGNIIGILGLSFNKAFMPWLYGKLKNDKFEDKKAIVRFTYIYFVFFILLALGLSFIAPSFLSFFVGKEFAGASIYVLYIALGFAFSSMHKMVVNYIYYAQKTAIYGLLTIFILLLNIILNYYFITRNGPIGAAQATTITHSISFVLTWVLSSKVYKMPWLRFKISNHKNI